MSQNVAAGLIYLGNRWAKGQQYISLAQKPKFTEYILKINVDSIKRTQNNCIQFIFGRKQRDQVKHFFLIVSAEIKGT